MLETADLVGGTFWLLSAAVAATTVFLFAATFWVDKKWKPVVGMAGGVTLVATILYFNLSELWMAKEAAPVIYRYVDWILTIPMQLTIFYLIVAPLDRVSISLFWRLVVVSVVMILAAFMGEAGYMDETLGFLIWLAGWLYILGELYMGQASDIYSKKANDPTRVTYFWNRLIITIGFAIPILGYFIDHFAGGVDPDALNVVYNLADILNKVVFCLIVYQAAAKDSASKLRESRAEY
jgi:sensory rhodopsin